VRGVSAAVVYWIELVSALAALQRGLTAVKFHPSVLAVRRMRKSMVDAIPSLRMRLDHRRRAALAREFRECVSVADCIAFTQRHMASGSCQIPSEVDAAIRHIGQVRPRVMCEIGTFDGGTSLLFSRFLPSVELMICIDLYVKNKAMIRLLAPRGQTLHFIDAPSYAAGTVQRVRRLLGGRQIDALFIDGDHRYEGVKRDFVCYRPFVRDGGIVLFHDIVPDDGGRAWAGGVPLLWRELSPRFRHREFIDNPGQAGYGIGALTV